MFGGWSQLANPPEDLVEKERAPPPPPIKLDFPKYCSPDPTVAISPASSRHLFHLLCSLRRPSDITPDFLQTLNLTVVPNATFEDLLPDGTEIKHVASKSTTSQKQRIQQNSQELGIPQSAAFREIIRLPPLPNVPRARLSHTRKFWTGLEKMSQYWDTSLDQYYDIPNCGQSSSKSSGAGDLDVSMSDPNPSNSSSVPTNGTTKQVYKGRRTGNGASMPSSHLEDTVSGLVETVVWAYNCQVRARYLPPRLSVRNLLFPVRQTFIVGRIPQERDVARRGLLEGPILGVCCRGETSFQDEIAGVQAPTLDATEGGGAAGEEVAGSQKSQEAAIGWQDILDLSREVAVMLLLAQERAREGKIEPKPGEGKWWACKPRWFSGAEADTHAEPAPSSQKPDEADLSTVESAATADSQLNSKQIQRSMEKASFEMRAKRKADGDLPLNKAAGAPMVQEAKHTEVHTTERTTGAKEDYSTRTSRAKKGRLAKPPVSSWDRKMRYMKIGAPSSSRRDSPSPSSSASSSSPTSAPSSSSSTDPSNGEEKAQRQDPPDQIFMVSSINHHVALLSMPVSSRYLDWLAGTETTEEELGKGGGRPGQQQTAEDREKEGKGEKMAEDESGLRLKRTRWFDLFNEDDRVEFIQGLWGVMDWLMRDRS